MTRPDSVNDTGSTMSNASGNFVYYYVLNGIAGTYTVSATDGINSASTTFSESRYRLQGYTKLPHAGWTDGILKGWFECENVPYRLKMVEVENKTYVLSNYHDNELKGVLGIDYCTDFYVGYQNGSAAPSTQVTFSVSGPFYQKPVKIKEIYYTWNVMYTLEAVGKTYYLYWKAHLASGSSNWPGAKLHAKTDVTGAQDVPVAVPPAVLGEISGYKFNDLDGDGVWDVSEPVLTDGWTINLYMWDETTSEWVFQTSTTTDTNGYYSFTNLFYGDYKVTEDAKEGWTNTLSPAFPITLNDTNPTSENNNFGNKQIECTVVFYTVPSTVGSITFEGVTYTDGQSDTFLYGTSGLATANAPEGWEFDHWEVTGNVDVSSTTDNPTTVTITCGGPLKAVFKQIVCQVTFYTDPSTVGSISFEGGTYTHGQSDIFTYGTSGLATANTPAGWEFDHWEVTGNVVVSDPNANPTTVTVTCGGTLKAVFKQIMCTVTFYTDPSTVGSVTFEGVTYTNGQSDTFPYDTSGLATANAPTGWVFDHWETVGNVEVSSATANPTTFTITCGGNLTAVFRQIECTVTFYTGPSTVGSITFEGQTYTNGQSDTFTYDTSGLATATAPVGWVFDHWEVTGNVEISSATDNPTTVTVTCGGSLKAVFTRIMCTVTFYTEPSTVGSISFEGVTYTHGQSGTFTYGTSGLATANAPEGWQFDHWEATGNVAVSDPNTNPTSVTITCGGSLKAVFKEVPPPEYIGGEMILFKADKPSSIQGRVELTALFLAATVASIILIRRKKRRQ